MLILTKDGTWYDFYNNYTFTEEEGWKEIPPGFNKLEVVKDSVVILYQSMLFSTSEKGLGFVELDLVEVDKTNKDSIPELLRTTTAPAVVIDSQKNTVTLYDACMNCFEVLTAKEIHFVHIPQFMCDGMLAEYRCMLCGVVYCKFFPLIFPEDLPMIIKQDRKHEKDS